MANQVGQQFGNYRLTRLLGSGGFAEVYLGEHVYLKTQAAIKVLQTHVNPNEFQDFLTEAQTIAALKHPRIVRVLDFGVQSTVPFLVMDYAPLGTLRDRHPSGSQLPVSTILPYVKQIAQALQYAHDHQLVHRDIKPENMLVETANEVLLSDFGIAIIAHKTQSLSTQEAIGTVSYMAPEQIKGKARPASDQYSLGIVVYEWLCGVRPFEGTTAIEVAMSHLTDPPPPLRTKVPTIPVEVEAVVLKALAKEPQQRFASVQTFAEALEQASQPAKPTVRSASPPQRASVSPPPGTLLCTYRGHSSGELTVAWSPDGSRLASAGGDETVQVWDTQMGQCLLTYTGHSDWVVSVAWSPDGNRLASADSGKTVQIWDARTGQRLLTYTGHHSPSLFSVAWSPDGSRLASAGGDETVQIWDARTGQRLLTYTGHTNAVYSVAWSPDGDRLACAGGYRDNTIQVWDARTGRTILVYSGHSDTVWSVSWSLDGTRLASGSEDKTVQVWNAADGGNVFTYRGHTDWVNSVAWSPDGNRLASAGKDHTVQIWDARTGQRLLTYTGHSKSVSSVAWSPDGNRLASAGEDHTVQVWQAP